MPTISLAMIAQNEEQVVLNALTNVVNYVDEAIIVDGGSKDKTVELIKNFPKVKLFQIPFKQHFANQKNEALKLATMEWILWMDADELFDNDLLENLQRLTDVGFRAYTFPRKTRIDSKLYNIIEPDYQIRFWKNNIGVHFEGRLHESPVGFKTLEKCNMWIEHNKTTEQQQIDNELYWDMGQNPPPGWYKENEVWKYKEEVN